jgi:putative methionine-R-sulfoxide reductase with GAF domain
VTARPDQIARHYAPLIDLFQAKGPLPTFAREERMQEVVEALWEATGSRGVSWIGFYLKDRERDELVLGPRRDKPACSPIGLGGVCGRCWLERRPILVADVARLGTHYIACDPRDRSEAVIPLFEPGGACWGVLDADSHDVGCFETADIVGMTTLVEHAGLSVLQPSPLSIIRL